METLSDLLERGEVARLIPVLKDSQREDRASSIFLAGLMAVDDLAKSLLGGIGQRVGARAKLTCYTQVVYKKLPSEIKHRPDGLIEVRVGSKTWYALVEAKIGNAELVEEQIRDYVQIAKLNGIPAVLTISNQFATLPTHHPVKLGRALPKSVELFHWSWMHIVTQATLLLQSNEFASREQCYILEEMLRYFSHPSVGVSGFDRMNPEWRDVVAKVQTGAPLAKTSDEVTATVASWHQESRDLSLLMSRTLRRNVGLRLSRAHANDPAQRLMDDSDSLTKTYRLTAILEVPDAAAPIEIIADLRRRTIHCSMRLSAPEDKQRPTARTNWLLRQLKETPSEDILINALWPGRSPPTQAALSSLREDPKLIEVGKQGAQSGFEVIMIRDLAGKFGGRRTFIEMLESMVLAFYEKIGQHLRVWVPPPPKLEPEPRGDTEEDTGKPKTVHAPETDSAKPSSLPLVDDSDEA